MPRGITIVGLGPGSPGLLTVEAQRVLRTATEIYVRTRKHPTVEALPSSAVVHSFDHVYEQADAFERVYAEIASQVVALGNRAQGVIYAVPGHPLVGETSVQRILDLAEPAGLGVRIVEGLSFLEPVCTLLRLDALDGLQIADAMTLAVQHYPEFSPDLPLLVGQLYSEHLASDVKLLLMLAYPEDHPITLIQRAGTDMWASHEMALYELDRFATFDHLTSLFMPPLRQPGSLAAFQEVVARLRAPGGCLWDREQTHSSLRPFLLEEAHEVLQALDEEDVDSLREELGDLLLQVLLHTQIAIEEHEFRMADVVAHVVAKLKRRHPHVFGQTQVSSAQDVVANWERIKQQEKDHSDGEGPLAGVPLSLPALSRAQALQRRGARLGFYEPDSAVLRAEIEERWQALREVAAQETAEALVGDLLFSLADWARGLDVDAESALRRAATLFERRFGSEAHGETSQDG